MKDYFRSAVSIWVGVICIGIAYVTHIYVFGFWPLRGWSELVTRCHEHPYIMIFTWVIACFGAISIKYDG